MTTTTKKKSLADLLGLRSAFAACASLAGLSLSLAALPACAPGPLCKDSGSCGGNPAGIWTSIATADDPEPGCVDGPYFTPTNVTSPGAPFDQTLFGRAAPTAGQPLAPPTLADWCEGLQLQKDPTKPFAGRTFVFQDPDVTSFQVAYNADSTYQAGFVRTKRAAQYYSHQCLTQFGWDPSDCAGAVASITKDDDIAHNYNNIACQPTGDGLCGCTWTDSAGKSQMQSGNDMYCTTVGVILNREGTDETFKNVICETDTVYGDGGCNCGFTVTFPSGGDIGFYKIDGNVITHYPENTGINYKSQSLFCQSGDSLEVSGLGNSYLFNKPPVRTFRLTRFTPPNP